MIRKNHYFFLLNLSPWPFLIRVSSFNFFLGVLFLLKGFFISSFFCSLLNLGFCSFFWWVYYRSEFNLEGKNSILLERGLKFSIILFISSEIFFFFSFFWSYFHFFLSPIMELGLRWPPVGTQFFDFLGVPLINTVILLRSGVTITVSHFFLVRGRINKSNLWLFLTIFLGLLFSFFQMIEYNNSFFSIRDGSFGSVFFILTGFHGIHVVIGFRFLIVILIRSLHVASSVKSFVSFELASWYWHFVDVVWIFLYRFLYYLVN